MKMNKLYTLAAVSLSFLLFSHPAIAGFGAAALGSDGSWGWATDSTQKEANKRALVGCNGANPKKDCTLTTTKALVHVGAGKDEAYGRSPTSLSDARKAAFRNCTVPNCKVIFETVAAGFYALARAENGADSYGGAHLAYGYDDSEAADKAAIARCSESTGRKCTLLWWGVIPGKIKSALAVAPAPKPAQGDCRPNTTHLRCESQCTNGACVVTYENGCRIRVQVQPRFDGFTNQWNYPSPSC